MIGRFTVGTVLCVGLLACSGNAPPNQGSKTVEVSRQAPSKIVTNQRVADAAVPTVKPDAAQAVVKPTAPAVPLTYEKLPPINAQPAPKVVMSDFIGAQACASCHQKAFKEWQKSSHGLAGGRPSPKTVVPPFAGKPLQFADAVVTPRRKGNEYWFDVREGNRPIQKVKVTGVVGRGLMKGGGTQVYLTEDDAGRMLMLPFDYSVTDKKWFCQAKRGRGWEYISSDLSISDCEWPPWRGLGVTGGPNCQNCHASQVEVLWDGDRGSYETNVKSLSIDCESCHGPGRAHRTFHTNGAKGTDPMPSSVGLSTEESLNLCMRCHATKSVTAPGYLSGRGYENFFAHQHMVDDDFSALDTEGRIREFSYQEGHLLSACYAKGAMVCTDCHAPHGLTYRDIYGQPLADWSDDRQCTGCHTGTAESAAIHPGHSKGAKCVNCHMPYMQHPGVQKQVSYKRSDHRIVSPVKWDGDDAVAGDACLTCHQWDTKEARSANLRKAFGQVKPRDPRLVTLAALEKAEIFGANYADSGDLDAALKLLSSTEDWPDMRTVRLLTILARFNLSARTRNYTPIELSRLAGRVETRGIELRAAAAALLLLISDVQPEAGREFERVLATVPTSDRLRFSNHTSFNLFAILMSYGFDDRGVTGRLLRVIKRFASQLGADGPRKDLFEARALAAIGNHLEAIKSYQKALMHPDFKQGKVPIDKGGTPQSTFGELSSRYSRAAPEKLLNIYKVLPDYLKKDLATRLNRCRLLRSVKQIGAAETCYQELLASEPKLAQAHFEHAQVFLESSQQELAIGALKRGLAVDPDNKEAKELLEFLELRNWKKAR